MTKLNQRSAVFAAVVSVMGEGHGKYVPSKEQKSEINAKLVAQFINGEIELSKEMDNDEIKSYVPGLVSNWLRKDPNLNGGVKYVAKNPGSRAGSTDPQIKALREYRKTLTTEAELAECDQYITTRLAEIAKTKVKATKIDVSALPAELQSRFSNN